MKEDTTQWLITLICEDREEVRATRSNITAYSATFMSIIFGTLAASRGVEAILTTKQSTYLSIGLVLVYVVFALERFISLCQIRKYLNHREKVFLGTDKQNDVDYCRDRIEMLYFIRIGTVKTNTRE